MQAIWIIIIIVWIVVPILAKKKQQQAKEQAARERAARQRAAQAAMQQQTEPPKTIRTVPLAPTVRPAQYAFEGTASTEGTGSIEGTGSLEGTASRDEGSAPHQIGTKLRQMGQSPQHVVTASSVSGHAHEETSMTGIRPDCPPDAKPAAAAVAPVSAESAFVWNQSQALSGIVLSEILGPCLAMRD